MTFRGWDSKDKGSKSENNQVGPRGPQEHRAAKETRGGSRPLSARGATAIRPLREAEHPKHTQNSPQGEKANDPLKT